MIRDRKEAGQSLAKKLQGVGRNCIVLAIPRGGVVVGNEIAKRLDYPIDVAISKKITPPEHSEYAIGAITFDGTVYKGESWEMYSDHPNFKDELNKKKEEVKRRVEKYRGNLKYEFGDKTIILVDDGIATGATVFAILKWLSGQKIKKIILAVPVISAPTLNIMKKYVSSIVALEIPGDFSAVGQFYLNFEQVEDEEVNEILQSYSF